MNFLAAFWSVMIPLLGCLLGFAIREAMAISTRRNSTPPSWSYYWSLAKNRWTFFINAMITIAVMLGRNELVTVGTSDHFAAQWPNVYAFTKYLVMTPFWSSLAIGLFAAFVVRWGITMIDQRFGRSKKIREGSFDAIDPGPGQ